MTLLPVIYIFVPGDEKIHLHNCKSRYLRSDDDDDDDDDEEEEEEEEQEEDHYYCYDYYCYYGCNL